MTEPKRGNYFTMTCLFSPGETAREVLGAAGSNFIKGEWHDSRPATALLDQMVELQDALRECLKVLADCHETINGAVEMEVVEELTNETMNAAHRGSYECIKKYSHLIN